MNSDNRCIERQPWSCPDERKVSALTASCRRRPPSVRWRAGGADGAGGLHGVTPARWCMLPPQRCHEIVIKLSSVRETRTSGCISQAEKGAVADGEFRTP